MNHRLGETSDFTPNAPESIRQKERRMRTLRVLGISALAASIVAGPIDSLDGGGSPTASKTEYLSKEKSNPHSFEDMTVIALDDPTDQIESRENLEGLQDTFTEAVGAMSRTVDGYFVVPESIDVVHAEVPPDGVRTLQNGKEVSCYSDDAFMAVRESVLDEKNLAASVLTPIAVESEAFACDPARGETVRATFYRDKHEGGIYFKNVLRTAEDAEALVIHELGHERLGHNGAMTRNGKPMPVIAEGHRDLTELLSAGEYALQKSGTDEVNVYAGRSTVMGGLDSTEHEVFNFVEINTINHDVAPIQKVSEHASTAIELGIEPGTIRGISLDIPPNHPLRRIAGGASITRLHIGLNATNGDQIAELAIIAEEDSGATYSIDTMSYIPAFDYDRGATAIYTDSSLGLQVTAEATEAQAMDSDGSRVLLHVQPYEK